MGQRKIEKGKQGQLDPPSSISPNLTPKSAEHQLGRLTRPQKLSLACESGAPSAFPTEKSPARLASRSCLGSSTGDVAPQLTLSLEPFFFFGPWARIPPCPAAELFLQVAFLEAFPCPFPIFTTFFFFCYRVGVSSVSVQRGYLLQAFERQGKPLGYQKRTLAFAETGSG